MIGPFSPPAYRVRSPGSNTIYYLDLGHLLVGWEEDTYPDKPLGAVCEKLNKES